MTKAVHLLILIGLSAFVARPADAQLSSGCERDSWIAGLTEICNGELIYRDHVYDDYGAATGKEDAEQVNDTAGKVRYLSDVSSADLVTLRLSVVDGNLHVSFEMNALFNPDSTFAALAIDTDNDQSTGGGAWADLLAVESPHGSGSGQPLVSDGWEEVHLFETGDPDTNLIEGVVPLPPGNTWRLQAVTGIKSRRVVMNVAFRTEPAESNSDMFDALQAATLDTTDISELGYVVDVSKLTGAVTEPPPAVTGAHVRVYRSDYTVAEDPATGEIRYDLDAEGMTYDGILIGETINTDAGSLGKTIPLEVYYVGKFQPYAVYLPDQPGPHGMQILLHGKGGSHNSLIFGEGMRQYMAEDYNVLIVSPLARGPENFFIGPAERDVMDVMADVEANYPIDPDRRYVAGYSMGGYGVHRISTFYPDKFAGYIDWNGWSYINEHDRTETMRNARYVPLAALYGALDTFVSVHDHYLPLEEKFLELEHEGVLWMHPAGEHLILHIIDDRRKEASYIQTRTRVRQPAQVTFRSIPATWDPGVDVIHDGAYWVDEMLGHDTGVGDFVDVDFVTYGCGGSLQVTERDLDGAGTDPIPWTSKSFSVAGATPLAQSNRIEGTLSNVQSVTIDTNFVDGACLGTQPVEYEFETDAAATVSLSDGRQIVMTGPGIWTGTTGAASNSAPDARDDAAQTTPGQAVVIDVLANDIDTDGDELSIIDVTAPANGWAVANEDGTITYTPTSGYTGSDSFNYTVSDGRGGTDVATVTVQVSDSYPATEGRVHGAGYVARGSGGQHDKINFSFDASVKAQGLTGKLKVRDKDADVTIDADTITSLSTGQGQVCDGEELDGVNSFAFQAVGEIYDNGTISRDVTFYACGVDNGNPGKGGNGEAADIFHVEASGLYSTGARTPDSGLDGGNVHIKDTITPASASGGSASSSGSSPQPGDVTVLELDPILVSTAAAGQPFAFLAKAQTASGPAANETVTLQWGSHQATAVTNALGVATFTVVIPAGDTSYTAHSGDLESNAVEIRGL